MTTETPLALHAELRAAVGHSLPTPPNLVRISEKRLGYKGETALNEFRVLPHFTGTYAEVNVEVHTRNAALMPYQSTPDGEPVIPIRYYAHPVPKEI